MRRVCYVTGTRADFGLMRSTLELMRASAILRPGVLITGMHYSKVHGETWREVEAAGVPVIGRCPVDLEPGTGLAMGIALATSLRCFMEVLAEDRPEIILLLGDRGEMLAGALAGLHLNIPVVHLHGGERTGTIDEPVRHAISKLSHYHFVATDQARERLVKMGESPDRIHITGAPGLDGIDALPRLSRETLCAQCGFDPRSPVILLLFHPVVQTADTAGCEAAAALESIAELNLQCFCVLPNTDAGNRQIEIEIRKRERPGQLVCTPHVPRATFLSWLAAADVLVGNSSGGIIEAASFGIPVVNIGSRQRLRERNANVVDCSPSTSDVIRAIREALSHGRYPCVNVYGDGHAGPRILTLLESLPLGLDVIMKVNSY